MKEGYKTTEFWLALLGSVLGVAVTAGILTPEQSSALVESASQISGAIITALSALGYSVSRGLAKKDTR